MHERPSRILDPHRLAAVEATGLLDTGPEEAFDRLARLASVMLETPFAFVTLVDDRRSFWKSCIGVEAATLQDRQNTVEESFCQYVINLGDGLLIDDAAAHPLTCDNPSIASMGVAAWAGFPIPGPGGEPLGSFCVVDTRVRSWTTRDGEVLHTLSLAAAGEIALRQAAAEAEQHARELEAAAVRSAQLVETLQRSLLPPHLPRIPGVDVAASYVAGGAGDVMGDFYDVFQLGARRWGVTLGDVSGKGVGAAQVAAFARYSIRTAAMREHQPCAVLATVNEALVGQKPHGDEGFVTVAYLEIDLAPGGARAVLASAGHMPVLLRGAAGVTEVGVHGLPLGLFDDALLVDTPVALTAGDVVLLYSDGVTEARRGEEEYGGARLRRALGAAPATTAAAVVAAAAEDLGRFTGHIAPADDTALLALGVRS